MFSTSKRKAARATERPFFDEANPPVLIPFNGTVMFFRIRKLTTAQVLTMGSISLIETFHDKIAKKKAPSIMELNEYAERQHQLCKLAMVAPTYDEVIAEISNGYDFKELDEQLKEIKALFRTMKDGPAKKELQDKYNVLELRYKFLLPGDFIGAVMDFCLGISESEIKKVTREMLLNAAVLAVRGHDNPSDHIDKSLLRPHHIIDFDNRAWIEFDKEQEANKKKRA